MSTLSATAPTLRGSRARLAAALLMPIGPAAIAALRYVLPYDTVDSTGEMARKVAADPGTQSAVLWLGLIGVLAIVPTVLWVAQLTRAAAPRLTVAATLLTVPGYVALAFLIGEDQLLWSGTDAGSSVASTTRLVDHLHPTIAVAGGIFVLGHVVGTILLGLALWHSRVVPGWAAIATIVSQPIHFVAAVILVSHPLDLVGWGLNAVGFAAAGLAFARRSS